MREKIFPVIFFLFCSPFIWAGNPLNGFVTNHHTITRELEVTVFVPEDYDPGKAYPVLYFNDGEGFEAGLHLDFSAITHLIKKGELPSLIMVAIYAGGNRHEKYNPYMDSTIMQSSGPYFPKGEQYSRQLVNVLLPFIEQKYSINKEKRGLIGISLGGLQSSWLALKHPGVFSFIGSISPAFWVKNYALLKEDMSQALKSTRFYFDIGTGEWNYYLPFIKRLEEAGLEYGKDIFYREIPGARHLNQDWKGRMVSIVRLFLLDLPGALTSWTIEVECIPSARQPGRFFRRINPVVFLEGNIPYSLAYAAKYTIVKGSGVVKEDGRFEIKEGNSMTVEVSYREWSKKVKVKNCH